MPKIHPHQSNAHLQWHGTSCSELLLDLLHQCCLPFSLLKEVSVLLNALEKRQLALEWENAQLKEELSAANTLIEEGDKAREELIEKLSKAQQY